MSTPPLSAVYTCRVDVRACLSVSSRQLRFLFLPSVCMSLRRPPLMPLYAASAPECPLRAWVACFFYLPTNVTTPPANPGGCSPLSVRSRPACPPSPPAWTQLRFLFSDLAPTSPSTSNVLVPSRDTYRRYLHLSIRMRTPVHLFFYLSTWLYLSICLST